MNGRLVALNRFISQSTDNKLFFQALKKKAASFRWNEKCEVAFQELKIYLVSPPCYRNLPRERRCTSTLLSRESAVSGALVSGEEGAQKPVHNISHTMNGPQTRYQRLEKLVLALFIILRKLKYYFHIFLIMVLTEHPLRSIVENPKATGRISKWASKLRSYNLIRAEDRDQRPGTGRLHR